MVIGCIIIIFNYHRAELPLVKSELQTHFFAFVLSDESSEQGFYRVKRQKCNTQLHYGISFSNNTDFGTLTLGC